MLKKRIMECIESIDGTIGIIVKNIENDEVVKINEEVVFPSASVIKLPILWELFKKIDQCDVKLDDVIVLEDDYKVGGFGVLKEMHAGIPLTIEDIATLMIILSDNTATNILIEMLKLKNINETTGNLGMHNTVLQRKMMDFEAKKQGLDNYTSPEDILKIYEDMLNSSELSEESRGKMIEILLKQQCNNKLPAGMPTEVRFAHKTGDLPGVEHDTGILFSKKGPVIIVVLTKDLKSNLDGIKINNEIGTIVHTYFK